MKALITLLAMLSSLGLSAQVGDCTPPVSQVELAINNVRAMISNGLQHFEDNGNAAYQVPKLAPGESGPYSIYADGLWLGGYTMDDQLHFAAVSYRSGGSADFYPGPLRNDGSASTSSESCDSYDGVFIADRTEAILHREYYDRLESVAGGADPSILTESPFENGYEIPESFYEWPGTNFDPNYSSHLAPYIDRNGDGIYDPEVGDYPGFDLNGSMDCHDCSGDSPSFLMGHRAAWYVSNDASEHTESGGLPMGLEIQVTTFQYSGFDELDETTFTRYQLINRSSSTYTDFTIGKWVDMDVGCAEDDYVGCDVARGMGYTYNGDSDDSDCAGILGYGDSLVAQGMSILCGPFQDADGIDNPLTTDVQEAIDQSGIVYAGQGKGYGDGIIDNECIGMRHFLAYNRSDQTPQPDINGSPGEPVEMYNLVLGQWLNEDPITYGGNGVGGSTLSDYMFPGLSDPLGAGTDGVITDGNWSEETAGHEPGDRRFILSTGPFTFDPGEITQLTVAYLFAQVGPGEGNALAELANAHDAVQAHFESCFELALQYPISTEFEYSINGGNVDFYFPQLGGENFLWDFGDGTQSTENNPNNSYAGPGMYEVCVSYEIGSESVEICETIYIAPEVFYPTVQITRMEGRGCGENYIELEEQEILNILEGPDFYEAELTYKSDHGPIKVAVYDEVNFVPGQYAIRLYDDVEDPEQWKLWKVGESDTIFSQQDILEMHDQYIPEYGLVVSIAQPDLEVYYSNYSLPRPLKADMQFADSSTPWLTGVPDVDENSEQNWIRSGSNFNNQENCNDPDPTIDCYYYDKSNLDNEERFEDLLGGTWAPWNLCADSHLGPSSQGEGFQSTNVTKLEDLNNVVLRFTSDKSQWSRTPVIEIGFDPATTEGGAEKITPRRALSIDKNGLDQLNGGDIDECTLNGTQVFTQEVLDDMDAEKITAYKVSAFPQLNPDDVLDSDLIGLSFGMSWFPGYAVDIETGYRCNMLFGENSSLPLQNGRDMIWNPSSDIYSGNLDEPVFGGGHYIYILRSRAIDSNLDNLSANRTYDQGTFAFEKLTSGTTTDRRNVMRASTWVNMPVLSPGYQLTSMSEGLIPTETTIRLNVSKSYRAQMYAPYDEESIRSPLYNFTVPEDIFSAVDEFDLGNYFGLYPNPTTETLYIQQYDESIRLKEIRLFDMMGREVLRSTDLAAPAINVSSLSSGSYFVKLEDKEGRVAVKRFVKRR